MRHWYATPAAIVVLLTSLNVDAAGAAPWAFRAHALTSDYTKNSNDANVSGVALLELDAGAGLQAAFEVAVSPRFSWELSAGSLGLDATSGFSRLVPISFDPLVLERQVTMSDAGTLELRPLTAALLFRAPLGRLTLSIGPLAGVSFFDAPADLPDRDAELTYGGKVGADVRLGSGPWAVSVEVRHLQIVHEGTDRDLYRDIGLQTVAVGFSYGSLNRPQL